MLYIKSYTFLVTETIGEGWNYPRLLKNYIWGEKGGPTPKIIENNLDMNRGMSYIKSYVFWVNEMIGEGKYYPRLLENYI